MHHTQPSSFQACSQAHYSILLRFAGQHPASFMHFKWASATCELLGYSTVSAHREAGARHCAVRNQARYSIGLGRRRRFGRHRRRRSLPRPPLRCLVLTQRLRSPSSVVCIASGRAEAILTVSGAPRVLVGGHGLVMHYEAAGTACAAGTCTMFGGAQAEPTMRRRLAPGVILARKLARSRG